MHLQAFAAPAACEPINSLHAAHGGVPDCLFILTTGFAGPADAGSNCPRRHMCAHCSAPCLLRRTRMGRRCVGVTAQDLCIDACSSVADTNRHRRIVTASTVFPCLRHACGTLLTLPPAISHCSGRLDDRLLYSDFNEQPGRSRVCIVCTREGIIASEEIRSVQIVCSC